MTATELAAREARQNAYDAMLARQDAFERSREVVAKKQETVRAGCVFAKSCNLPDAIIDYSNPSGMVPTDSLKDYGEVAWLGAREADDGRLLERVFNLNIYYKAYKPLSLDQYAELERWRKVGARTVGAPPEAVETPR